MIHLTTRASHVLVHVPMLPSSASTPCPLGMTPRSFTTSCAALKKQAAISRPKILGRISNNLSAGVVGLANVGKSTFFQAITKSQLGNPANYPYATIDPSQALVEVQSNKLAHLAKLYASAKMVPTSMTIFDIAGLTRNAALGEGLGNKFLSDIRQVDGIFHVVRGFRDDSITHIESSVDPIRDMAIVTDELLLKDIETVEAAAEKMEKTRNKPGVSRAAVDSQVQIYEKVIELLYSGRKVTTETWNEEEIDVINALNLLTAKPSVVLVNVLPEDYIKQKNEFMEDIRKWVGENCPEDHVMMFSAAMESTNKETSKLALPQAVDSMREALRLISFYTCGPKEAHQWTIRQGSTAPEAAGTIHSDLQKTFISAQVYKWEDLQKEHPPLDELALRARGKQHRVGKTYTMEDGDVMVVRAANGSPR